MGHRKKNFASNRVNYSATPVGLIPSENIKRWKYTFGVGVVLSSSALQAE